MSSLFSLLRGKLTLVDWLEENQPSVRRWRQYSVRTFYVLAIALALHGAWTFLDPLALLTSKTSLERQTGVKFFNSAQARLVAYRRVAEFAPPLTEKCHKVVDRTGELNADFNGVKYSVKNLFSLNRKIITREKVAFAMPKMLDAAAFANATPPPNLCVLSILLTLPDEKNASSLSVRILDMMNPVELDLRASERSEYAHLTEYADFRDLMLSHRPVVTIESLPFIRINYKSIENSIEVLTLEGVDAHFARIALRLLNGGEPLSAWGTVSDETVVDETVNDSVATKRLRDSRMVEL